MAARQRREELLRLQKAFEAEAAQFHDLSLSVFYLTQKPLLAARKFRSPNHTIMLWQYYGQLGDDRSIKQLVDNLQTSNLKLAGLRGSEFSCFAALEGQNVDRFVRMATRAGSIFSEKESFKIKTRIQKDFSSNLPKEKSVFVGNNVPLAVWLNYVLHHLGKTHPRYLPEVKLHLDPFAASLAAIDKMLKPPSISSKRKPSGIELIHFRVSLSFPGERRPYVEEVAAILRKELGTNAVFYDNYFQEELARPNLDVLLQRIYHRKSDLIVVFLCEDYANKEWCGLEWRAIRDLIKQSKDDKIMLLRFDAAMIPGLLSIDGYMDISKKSSIDTAKAIITRLRSIK